ncbi:MAG: sigma-54 dependent transcriptional regulator, partial [Thermodesulfobacteriota bacterium]|nr:sigma-54 dependent transcriptional regulator [Thermodesulfobacteriota bacterium]
MKNYRILVVDDEHLIRWSLEQSLKKQGYTVHTVGSGEQALEQVGKESPDMVLLDIQLPGIDGIETLEQIKEIDGDIGVIMITALGVLETAVKAMQLGAYDYINKPFNLDELSVVLRKALETQALKKEVEHLRTEKKRTQGSAKIIAKSSHMVNALDMVAKVAHSEAATVLVQGESGTGKELVARALHYDSSRSEQPFMAINCAAVPETLLESELMGHEKGAFTDAKSQKRGLFEMANGGTVFLDEIGDMPMGTQAKLLRVLEERSFRRIGGTKDIHVDIRIVAATNKELLKAIEDG